MSSPAAVPFPGPALPAPAAVAPVAPGTGPSLAGGADESGDDLGPLMTPGEVARLFHVNTKTVSRWARSGKITSVRTLGGHRRYLAREIEALLNQPNGTN